MYLDMFCFTTFKSTNLAHVGIHIDCTFATMTNTCMISIIWQEHNQVLEKALHDTSSPLAIAEECLLQREKRCGIDQVNDDVEKALSRVSHHITIHCLLYLNSGT